MSELADDDEVDKFLSSKVVKSVCVCVFALVVVKTTCTLFASSFLLFDVPVCYNNFVARFYLGHSLFCVRCVHIYGNLGHSLHWHLSTNLFATCRYITSDICANVLISFAPCLFCVYVGAYIFHTINVNVLTFSIAALITKA